MKTNGDFGSVCRQVAATVAAGLVLIAGCDNSARIALEKANAQVKRIAEDLDKRTTATGVFVRVKEDEIKEVDPWGVVIKVSYSQGGIAEVISVRSAGPDKELFSRDDVVAETIAANFKGIGTGIKENAQETAANVAKGMVKGTFDGITESAKGLLPKKNDPAPPVEPPANAAK